MKSNGKHHLLYPMTTFLITSRYKDKNNAMAANWVMPVSFNPFLVAVAIGKSRYTYELIKKSKYFGIAVPPYEMKDFVLACGSESGKNADKFEKYKIKFEIDDVPVIKGCDNLICKVVDEVEAGDHVIFIGEVIKIYEERKGKKIVYTGEDFIQI
jgi:flavin reductase (DIM6/NTAB) family NADH-FMN oxidoreductase RutF